MKKLYLSMIFLSVLAFSCSKDDIKINSDNLLIGVWNYEVYQGEAAVFTRSEEFTENHCYMFNTDGTLIERKNSGWCGTPPVSYANFNGTWKILNDTLINVTVGYWGGTTSYKLDIESLNSISLKVITIPLNE
jgi:hypothetical protein